MINFLQKWSVSAIHTMVKNNQIHNGTINRFWKASRISDIQHIDILITRKVWLVEEQLAYGDVFNLIL